MLHIQNDVRDAHLLGVPLNKLKALGTMALSTIARDEDSGKRRARAAPLTWNQTQVCSLLPALPSIPGCWFPAISAATASQDVVYIGNEVLVRSEQVS